MGGEIEAGELHIESLLQDPLVLVCRRDDEFAKPKSVGWASLAGRRMVMLNNTSGSRQQIADTLTGAGVKPQVALELAQPSSVLAMVEANLGVAVVPRLVAPDLDSQSHQAIGQSHDLSVKASRPLPVACRSCGVERPAPFIRQPKGRSTSPRSPNRQAVPAEVPIKIARRVINVRRA